MREERELLICAVDLSCEKKRAEHGYLNGTQQTRHTFAYGHTFRNTPDPIWTRKLSLWGPGKYRGGGPRGKTFGCCRLLKIEFTFRDLTHGLNPKRQTFFINLNQTRKFCRANAGQKILRALVKQKNVCRAFAEKNSAGQMPGRNFARQLKSGDGATFSKYFMGTIRVVPMGTIRVVLPKNFLISTKQNQAT